LESENIAEILRASIEEKDDIIHRLKEAIDKEFETKGGDDKSESSASQSISATYCTTRR